MNKNHKLIAFLAFAMYFLTGATCIVVGSSLPHLVEMYQMTLDKVVLLGSAYALGRVSTVYLTGRLVEKIGAMKVLFMGTICLGIFLGGIPLVVNYYAGLFFAFVGGIGMGAQDTVCPVLFSVVAKENYAGALSAGQVLFALGNFSMPFLIGVLLAGNLPFFWSYYILLIVPVIMLICIPFVKVECSGAQEKEGQVVPLYAKNKLIVYGACFVICVTYFAVVNTFSIYTSSFAESIGISASTSAFMLTTYNIGCMVGSLVFTIVLKKVTEQTVLLVNNVLALVVIIIALTINAVGIYFVCWFIAGFFLGVLFSIVIAIATRIEYKRISRASALVAIIGGGAESLNPVVTGLLVKNSGVSISFTYAAILTAVCIIAAIILKMFTTEKEV